MPPTGALDVLRVLRELRALSLDITRSTRQVDAGTRAVQMDADPWRSARESMGWMFFPCSSVSRPFVFLLLILFLDSSVCGLCW